MQKPDHITETDWMIYLRDRREIDQEIEELIQIGPYAVERFKCQLGMLEIISPLFRGLIPIAYACIQEEKINWFNNLVEHLPKGLSLNEVFTAAIFSVNDRYIKQLCPYLQRNQFELDPLASIYAYYTNIIGLSFYCQFETAAEWKWKNCYNLSLYHQERKIPFEEDNPRLYVGITVYQWLREQVLTHYRDNIFWYVFLILDYKNPPLAKKFFDLYATSSIPLEPAEIPALFRSHSAKAIQLFSERHTLSNDYRFQWQQPRVDAADLNQLPSSTVITYECYYGTHEKILPLLQAKNKADLKKYFHLFEWLLEKGDHWDFLFFVATKWKRIQPKEDQLYRKYQRAIEDAPIEKTIKSALLSSLKEGRMVEAFSSFH